MYSVQSKMLLSSLESQKRLEQIQNKTIPRPIPEPVVPPTIRIKGEHVEVLPEDLMMKNLELIRRSDIILNNATQKERGRILKSAVHPVITPEMREKFLLNEKKAQLEVIKGKKGSLVNMPNVRAQLETAQFKYSNEDLLQSKKSASYDIQQFLQLIEGLQTKLKTAQQDANHETTKYNDVVYKLETKQSAGIKLTKGEAKGLDVAKKILKNVSDKIQALEMDTAQKIQAYEAQIGPIIKAYENIEAELKANKEEAKRVQANNESFVKTMEEEFNTLNRGRFNMTRGQNETEEEFLQRMEDMGNFTVEPEGLNDDIARQIRNILKNELKTIIRDDGTIDSILKVIEQRYNQEYVLVMDKLIEMFPFVKTKFVEYFGVFPSSVNVGVVADFIDSFVKDVDVNKAFQTEEKEEILKKGFKQGERAEELSESDEDVPEAPVVSRLKSRVGRKSQDFKLQVVEYYNSEGRGTEKPTDSKVAIDNGFKEVEEEISSMGATVAEGRKMWIEYQQIVRDGNMPSATPINEADDERSTGMGLKSKIEKFDDLCRVGNILILPKKLYYKNILSIRSLNGSSFTGIKDVKVTDSLVDVVLKLCEGKHPSHQDLKKLVPAEKGIYDELVYMAKLQKDVEHSGEDRIQQLKQRLAILEGQIDAGNNNPDIKKEIHKIVNVLGRVGALSMNSVREYLRDNVGGMIPKRKPKTVGKKYKKKSS